MELPTRQLSDRERTVLLLAADGLTDKEIAKRLSLSQRTIGTYWERMREKLGRYSRTQLVARFLRSSAKTDESANYRSLFASWEEGVWIVLEDGTTMYANHRLPDLFDMTSEEFETANARDLIETATSRTFHDLIESARDQDQQIEFCIKKADQTVVWLSMVATITADNKQNHGVIILRLTDVTVKRKVKSALDSCESSLQFLSDHCHDLIARFDANLKCTAVNPALKQLVQTEIVGEKLLELSDLFSPNDRWTACIVEALTSGKTQWFDCRCPGAAETVITHLLPLPTEDGKTLEVMSITSRVAKSVDETPS